jgi:hypothetical protein
MVWWSRLVLAGALCNIACSGAHPFVRATPAPSVVFSRVSVFDSRAGQLRDGLFDVRVADGRITDIAGAGTLEGAKARRSSLVARCCRG